MVQGIKGVLPTQVNVYDTMDTSNQAIITLPAGMVEDNKEHALKIGEREKNAASNLVIPGKNRHMMPPCPAKSKRVRGFENPQFYPFSTLPIEDAERTMQLRAIQRIIRSEKIDEEQKIGTKERMGKNKVFERKYDQYFSQDLMPKILQEAMSSDPDVSSTYYQRTDQLLLVLHNKINCQKRNSDVLDKPHGIKTWSTPYRVMPTFQNWINFYSPHVSPVQDYAPKDASEPPVKLLIDKAVIPKVMLDVDNHKIQNVEQTFNQFFPDDNSIINSETFSVGGVPYKRSVIYKDKYSFGVQPVTESSYMETPQQHGLVSYKPVGDQQFWLNFSDAESKMLIETVEAHRNRQRIVQVEAKGPSQSELAAREEAARQAAA